MTRETRGALFLVATASLVVAFIIGYCSAKVRYEPACSQLKRSVERECL